MSVLSLNNVKKSYKLGDGSEFPVLKGINVNIYKGDVVFVVGSFGSGKSTILRCLNLLEEPTQGQI